jgi:SHS2 domain-containing protein
MKKYELIEHTADIGIRIYGKNIKDLFNNAAAVLFTLLVEYEPKKKKKREMLVEAETPEELLVVWLNELISIFFTYKFLPAKYNIAIEENKELQRYILKANMQGEEFNPYENKKINMEIKAATYHNLKIEKYNKGYKAEVIFDV